jgi:hypothetical protein
MYKRQALAVTVSVVLALSMIPLVNATQIRRADVFATAKENFAGVEFLAQRVTTIDYSNGGRVKDILSNVNERYVFKADDSTPGIDVLKQKINEALLAINSPAKVAEVRELTYRVALHDDRGTKAVLEQSINLKVKITNIIIQEALYQQPAIIDLNWRGFKVEGQVPITFNTDGEQITMDINSIKGYFDARFPEVSSILSKDSNIARILNDPLINFERIKELPITQWHKLTNALQSMAEAEKWGVKEPAPAVTVVSAGESSIREGAHKERVLTANATIDGSTYKIEAVDPPISASLDIYYWAEPITDNHGDAARVYLQEPQGQLQQSSTGNFPLMVLLAFAGMMGAIAGFVIWRANKK